jgi:hypothetical protein
MKNLILSLIAVTSWGFLKPQLTLAAELPTAASVAPATNEILVVIGYSDNHHFETWKDLISSTFSFDAGNNIYLQIIEQLLLENYHKDPQNPDRFLNDRTNTGVTILSANVLCPGENPSSSRRSHICTEQLDRSEALKDYLEKNINRFHHFIYLGHSRLGMGLGLGPFYGEHFTYNIAFYNDFEAGNLQTVTLLSCFSDQYYRDKISRKTRIHFEGTDRLLPLQKDEILNKIEKLTLGPRKPSN